MVTAFERETGIKVAMTRKSSGEVYAQVKAEAANPRGDIWWGGTGDPHLQAAEEGLTVEYKSPKLGELQDWAVRQWERLEEAHGRRLRRRARLRLQHRPRRRRRASPSRSAGPICSIRSFKDEVQVADPNSSGTSYTMLATIVQLMGEDKGFEYLKALHKNINQYTKSGAAPAKAAEPRRDADRHHVPARRGRRWRSQGAPVKIVVAVRRHRLRDRLDVDHQGRAQSREREEVVRLGADRSGAELGAEGQELYQVPSNKTRRSRPEVAEARRDQADRLRFRQVRLVGGAPAAAVQVGQRGQEPAEVIAMPARRSAEVRGMSRSAKLWLALGWIGFALLPWHVLGGDWLDMARRTGHAKARAAPRAWR